MARFMLAIGIRAKRGKEAMNRQAFSVVVLIGAMICGLCAPARAATPGIIQINQASVTAAGGFPYLIGQSGSYQLTSDLVATCTGCNAIQVDASFVTIDLNGFRILGPGAKKSTAAGIVAALIGESTVSDLTVKNGYVAGFAYGIVTGSNSAVTSVHADNNGNTGIFVAPGSLVTGSTANNDVTNGIECTGSCNISGNAVYLAQTGIVCVNGHCVISNNDIDQATSAISGGASTLTNVCNGTVC
jgi:hypothetical protein